VMVLICFRWGYRTLRRSKTIRLFETALHVHLRTPIACLPLRKQLLLALFASCWESMELYCLVLRFDD